MKNKCTRELTGDVILIKKEDLEGFDEKTGEVYFERITKDIKENFKNLKTMNKYTEQLNLFYDKVIGNISDRIKIDSNIVFMSESTAILLAIAFDNSIQTKENTFLYNIITDINNNNPFKSLRIFGLDVVIDNKFKIGDVKVV